MKDLQNRVKKLLCQEDLSKDEKVQLLDDLYWADWAELNKDYKEQIDQVFSYIGRDDLSKEEIAKVLSLYNNLEGIYVTEFANVIKDYYIKDRVKFLKSLHLNPEEAINLVYIFKVYDIFEDGMEEFESVKDLGKLNQDELETAQSFFSKFRAICDT